MLHAWLAKFGPQVVGLTGTPSQIESVERSYHVYAQKLPSRHGGYGYDEGHSSTIFFIDKDRYIVSLHDPATHLTISRTRCDSCESAEPARPFAAGIQALVLCGVEWALYIDAGETTASDG